MTTPTGRSGDAEGITRIRVEGYKSLRSRHDIDVRPLTVLAGVNSSGKSSAMQPLLLLKQTLDTPYDPGPLQLSGPNVDVTAIEQVLSKTSRGTSGDSFQLGVTVADQETVWTFGRDTDANLQLLESSVWFSSMQDEATTLRAGMTSDHLRTTVPAEFWRGVSYNAEHENAPVTELAVVRDRCFLVLGLGNELLLRGSPTGILEYELSRVIHLPALRGNPRRTYPTAAVEDRFPGRFETYTAGVIAAWQSRGDTERLSQLRADLAELGLTWNVEAKKLDDTQVELMVGRLPRPLGDADRDLVAIADVGFGVSQTLPVVVALLAADSGQLVYLEQPEIHLHPRAQVTFANLLHRAVARGVRVVVETHSALLLRAVQTLVARQELRTEDVILHWFSRSPETGDTEIATAELDEAGAFGDWPEDFDEVQLESESRYLDAAAEAGGA